MPRASLWRLMDANANRALEGLRVCEDLYRLHYEQPALARRLRRLRHGLGAGIQRLPGGTTALLQARNSREDVGRRAATGRAASVSQLVVVNFQRAKEALRVLEECCRLVAPAQSRTFQQLRFETYEAERACLLYLAALRHP